jgi:hypothetical protein
LLTFRRTHELLIVSVVRFLLHLEALLYGYCADFVGDVS